jgi:hypothetical protein
VGFDNPNKSEFVKSFELAPGEKADLLAFLRSLTDPRLLTDPALSDPFAPPAATRQAEPPRLRLRGQVVRVYAEDGAVAIVHEEVPGLMKATRPPFAMEFLASDRRYLATLRPGMRITAGVRKRGGDYLLEPLPAAGRE